MNFRLLLFLAVFSLQQGFAQDDSGFKQSTTFPTFELRKADNSVFKSDKLKKNVPTAIIFFSPTCEHCQHQIEWMLKRNSDLKKYQFVWATYQPVEELFDFNKKYGIAKHTNYVTGRDEKYFFPPFYQIHNFPYIAFYDKHGNLIARNEGNMKVDDMIKKFNTGK